MEQLIAVVNLSYWPLLEPWPNWVLFVKLKLQRKENNLSPGKYNEFLCGRDCFCMLLSFLGEGVTPIDWDTGCAIV